MAETGVLAPDARVELLNGEIIDMSPIGPFHGSITAVLAELFTATSKSRWHTRAQNSLRLDDHSEPQPDVLLVKRKADNYRHEHPAPEDVFLLIEVSDTTLSTDQNEKLPAYGRAGIPEVWIVNLNEETVEVYREPHFTGYGSSTILRSGNSASPAAFPDVTVNLRELFGR